MESDGLRQLKTCFVPEAQPVSGAWFWFYFIPPASLEGRSALMH
jgi:hypothetical protein